MKQTIFFTVPLAVLIFTTGCAASKPLPQAVANNDFHYQALSPSKTPAEPLEAKDLPELSAASSLEDYLSYAALNNAGLEAAFYRWKASVEQITQAGTLPDPELTFAEFVRQSQMQMQRAVGLMQMFPWFGKLKAQESAAFARAQAATKELESVRLDLNRQVTQEYYEFLYLKEAIDIAKQNLELIRRFEQVALTKYITAAGTHPDSIRAQIELAELDEVLTSLKELIKPQTARLNALLNRSADSPLDWPQTPPFEQATADAAVLYQSLKENNPKLAQMQWMIEAAHQELKLAKLKSYPDIGIGVEWTQFEDSGDNDGRDSVALMFRMNLPIWTDSYAAARRQGRAEVRTAQRQKDETENELAAEVAQGLYDLEETARKIRLYEDILPRTEQLISTSESAYRADSIDFLSLIDAQRMLLNYHLNYWRARTDHQQKLAQLEALVAADISAANDTLGAASLTQYLK